MDKKFDIAMLGKQSIDDDFNHTGQMLSALMGIPVGTFGSKFEFREDGKSVLVTREVDFGLQSVELQLPAIFTCDLRLNTPRFANIKSILAAKKKPIETINI